MIRILWEKHEENLVSFDTIRDSIEKSRDRLRVLANMVLTASGLLLSACFVFIILLLEKFSGMQMAILLRISFSVSALFFLLAAIFSIVSSLLRARFTIVTELKFIDDLLKLIEREAKLFTAAFVLLVLGLVGLFVSILIISIVF